MVTGREPAEKQKIWSSRVWEADRHLHRKEDRFLKGRETCIYRERGRNRDREKRQGRNSHLERERGSDREKV